MSLDVAIRRTVNRGMKALESIGKTATYHQSLSSSYDTATGGFTASTNPIATKAILTKFNKREIDGENVRPDDRKALIAADALTGVTPQLVDTIDVGSDTWNIVAVTQDPAEALWVLHVRKP